MTLETSLFRSSLQRASLESTRTPHESLIFPLILNLNLTCDRNISTVSLQENMNLLYYRKSIKNAQRLKKQRISRWKAFKMQIAMVSNVIYWRLTCTKKNFSALIGQEKCNNK